MVFISCSKNSNSVIAPGFADELSGGNPNSNNENNPPIYNPSNATIINNVGIGSSWFSFGCQANTTCISTVNAVTNTTVTICFSSPPVSGSYQLVSSNALLSPGKAVLTVTNPPGQSAGSIWYSASGIATVLISSTSITASFTNITCLDSPGSINSVTLSGKVGCL